MAGRFRGKVVIVTGGAAGIGRGAALAFGREGARVLVADMDEARAEQTAEQIRSDGAEALAVKTDVSRDADVREMVEKCVQAFGRLDVAFNNAGIEGKPGPLHELTEESWDRVVSVNLKGVFLCMKYEIQRMLESGGGSIVNMASVAGLVGFRQMPAYVATKHGVVGLTRTAALDLARSNIRVNVVCPGAIMTEMIERFTGGSREALAELEQDEPMGRLGTVEEVAEAVLFLASSSASFITGHPLTIDGGMLAD